MAGTQFDKVIDLTRRRYGEDAIELIPIYQECGRVSFTNNKFNAWQTVFTISTEFYRLGFAGKSV